MSYDVERSYNATRDLFNATFQNNAISKSIVKRTIQRFVKTGTVKNRQN